jgi:hypothetical protein
MKRGRDQTTVEAVVVAADVIRIMARSTKRLERKPLKNKTRLRGGSRTPGGRVKEFFTWLRGLREPKYVPLKIRHGDRKK